MKCFIVLSAVLGLSAAQYYPVDTPEVAAAKQAHFAAHAQARTANNVPQQPQAYAAPAVPAYAPVQYQQQAAPAQYQQQAASIEDGESYPIAEPYYHEEILAEPYIHQDPGYQHVAIPAEAYVQQAGRPAAPIQQAAYAAGPAYPTQQAAYPAQQAAYNGCFNWKGEGVECRY